MLHPIIARRTWLWRAETGAVIEALSFAGGTLSQAGRDWLAGLGPVQADTIGPGLDSPVLGWAGIRLRCPSLADLSTGLMPTTTRPGISRASWARQR